MRSNTGAAGSVRKSSRTHAPVARSRAYRLSISNNRLAVPNLAQSHFLALWDRLPFPGHHNPDIVRFMNANVRCNQSAFYPFAEPSRPASDAPAASCNPNINLTLDIECQYHWLMAKSAELLQGTLDLLILRTLELQPLHGVGIADRIEQVTGGVFLVGPGSLFPALHRLAEKGWILGQWGELETGRRAKFYNLTATGKSQLVKEKRNWQKVLTAMNQVLGES
jgi:PadR family transcriptional regulator PadR